MSSHVNFSYLLLLTHHTMLPPLSLSPPRPSTASASVQTTALALTLVAALAPLYPARVLTGAVPVLTLMGRAATSQHADDRHTFAAVQQTLAAVVPPLLGQVRLCTERHTHSLPDQRVRMHTCPKGTSACPCDIDGKATLECVTRIRCLGPVHAW